MNCPYCGQPMEKGFIESPCTLSWSPTKSKIFCRANTHKKGNVVLAENGIWAPASLQAYLCTGCQKILIDSEETK